MTLADAPTLLKNSSLYARLQSDPELLNAVLSLRSVAERLADTIARSVPAFTDHSVRHMDALWRVTDRVLTASEVDQLSTGEAFLLATGFYLHDIGMAYAATSDGLKHCRESAPYRSFMAGIPATRRSNSDVEAQAVASAVRKLHAAAATQLATGPVPGTDIYLFESLSIRETWGRTCGHIAESHHWNIEKVEQDLGSGGLLPLPGARKGDLGYVAAILRIVDYAHINRDRAPTIDRAFRQTLPQDSLIHWLAQEQIDGPEREANELVYRAARPLVDVDAWWLYYEMLVGLDAEVRAVKRYLDRRTTSQGRFSLQSVRGSSSPSEAAVYIPTTGFAPIEINLRTGSIDRLVQLLAGESLYGPDPMAAVRELLQNARDAVMLKSATVSNEFDKASLSLPIKVGLKKENDGCTLEVTDWGVGMTQRVMTDYLLAIASDYWTSQFFLDFPAAAERGFRPAGKFGIGFLSVFMLGDSLTVESNRAGGDRLQLTLRGVGRRGELRVVPSPSGSGTAVRVRLKDNVADALRPLPDLVRAYAPMLSHPVVVEVEGQVTDIPTGWIFKMLPSDFHNWTLQAIEILHRSRDAQAPSDARYASMWRLLRRKKDDPFTWSGPWPEFVDSGTRLVASFESRSVLCLKGLALQSIRTPGFVGVIDLESAVPDVSRRQALRADIGGLMEKAKVAARVGIVENLNSIASSGLLIDKIEFLDECISHYGRDVILQSSVPWISLLKLPGEIELISSTTFLSRLTRSKSVFVAYDTGPWTAMRKWAGSEVPPSADELAVVLESSGQRRPPFSPSSRDKSGPLAELWPDCETANLLGTILRIIAESWQVNLGELTSQTGWHLDGTTIWGRLSRP